MMYIGMIETRSFKILLKSFHENYSDLFKKQHGTGRKSHLNSTANAQRLFLQLKKGFNHGVLLYT